MSGAHPSSSSPAFTGLSSSSSAQDIRGNGGTTGPRRGVKRPVGVVICNGSVESWEDKSSEIACPICFELLSEAMITVCGHTYCRDCIVNSIASSPRCPKCGNVIHKDSLVPNFALDEIVKRHVTSQSVKTEAYENAKSSDVEPISIVNFFSSSNYHEPTITEIENMMLILKRKKEILTIETEEHERALLSEFLSQLLKIKKAQKLQLDKEVNLIEQDLSQVESAPGSMVESSESSFSRSPGTSFSTSNSSMNGFNTTQVPELEHMDKEQLTLSARRRRMLSHFDELKQIYMEVRNVDVTESKSNDAMVPSDSGDTLESTNVLDDFGVTLSCISRYHALKPLATLSYSADLLANSNIVSSIEFDKDNEFFAIAGVTRKIKLFEYGTVIGSSVDIHCPTAELHCFAKISCVAWSSYFKNHLASSDYEGCVSLWDAHTGDLTRSLTEHEKRVWSVDWSNGDPRLLASGSDDSKVKLWSTNSEKSVITLEAKANVCCVKFCPQNSFVIAFGCADHCVHYYDFRQPKEPLAILCGHKKAVSYVKFASKTELVSASTDSHLKLWNLDLESSLECVRSFKGHTNEKNFVGLATDGNYIACGSENNSLYVYYKYLSKPLFSFKFDSHRTMLERPKTDESTEFVSAVAWKKGSPIVVAANSQGAIKILELI